MALIVLNYFFTILVAFITYARDQRGQANLIEEG